MHNDFNKRFGAAIFILALGLFGIYLILYLTGNTQAGNTATTPQVAEVPTTTPETSSTKGGRIELLRNPYVPSQNPFAASEYAKESIAIALRGQFSEFKINIQGTTTESGLHFMSLNVGDTSGVFDGVRNSYNGIDIQKTTANGGVFAGNQGFSFTIDFMGTTILSTTPSEYQSTRQPFKVIKLWDSVLPPPPTAFRFLAVPFNQSGLIGGATIGSVEVDYSCAPNSDCAVAECNPGQLFTACLKDNFGTSYAQQWCDNSGNSCHL